MICDRLDIMIYRAMAPFVATDYLGGHFLTPNRWVDQTTSNKEF